MAGNDGKVLVSINDDKFIEKFKGKPPIMRVDERLEVVKGCRYVDYVMVNNGDDDSKIPIEKAIDQLKKIDMVVIGSDWHDKDYLKQMGFNWDWLGKRGIGICRYLK